MNTIITQEAIRKSAISFTALSILFLVLISPASANNAQLAGLGLLSSERPAVVDNDPEAVYGRLKSKSREICGSHELRVAGGVKRSNEIKECYEGTLTAAVERLDDPEITELHTQ